MSERLRVPVRKGGLVRQPEAAKPPYLAPSKRGHFDSIRSLPGSAQFSLCGPHKARLEQQRSRNRTKHSTLT